jgi:4-amino-4-deoxy-L-arabinose transferase-like glycosyltransferase
MRRIPPISFAIVLAGLFALGLWFRVTSLGSMPDPDGDEAWYAVQVAHLLKGKPFEAFTPYANPLNPLFSGLHVPGLLAVKPRFWLLRVPAVLCGIAAVVLSYTLGRRIFDRTTAMIASALLAVLPVAIIFSRIGFDACQTPLFTLLAIYFAFRANRLGLILSFAACYLVHPTNVFLLPLLLAVFLVQELRQAAGDRPRQIRVTLVTLIVPVVLALGLGMLTLRRPQW